MTKLVEEELMPKAKAKYSPRYLRYSFWKPYVVSICCFAKGREIEPMYVHNGNGIHNGNSLNVSPRFKKN